MRRILALYVLCVMSVSMLMAGPIRVGVLLPLKDNGGRGTIMVEFYRGLLMAIESVKSEGVDVECYAMDCGSTEVQMQTLLENPAMSKLDVVFGPLDAGQVTALSEFCRMHHIRMVLPFNTPCPHVYSNPWIYQVGVSQELLYPGITNLVIENMGNSNFVFYHSGDADERGIAFTNHLSQVLKLRNMQTSDLASGADEFAYDRALNQFRENVVVIDSRSKTALAQMLAGLNAYMAKYPQYKVSLLGYPEWLTYTASYLQDFYRLNTYVYSAYYRNPLSGRTAMFEQKYLQNFGLPSRISYPRAEMLGYDLGRYFIMGLDKQREMFDEHPYEDTQKPVQHGFHFQRVGEQGGYVNTFVQLVHYGNNNTIQTLK